MAEFWQYFVPALISVGTKKDEEEAYIEKISALCNAYNDLAELLAARGKERLATKEILKQAQQALEANSSALARRDALLGSILEQLKSYRGPISNQFKESIERSIYAEWGTTTVTTGDSDASEH